MKRRCSFQHARLLCAQPPSRSISDSVCFIRKTTDLTAVTVSHRALNYGNITFAHNRAVIAASVESFVLTRLQKYYRKDLRPM